MVFPINKIQEKKIKRREGNLNNTRDIRGNHPNAMCGPCLDLI